MVMLQLGRRPPGPDSETGVQTSTLSGKIGSPCWTTFREATVNHLGNRLVVELGVQTLQRPQFVRLPL